MKRLLIVAWVLSKTHLFCKNRGPATFNEPAYLFSLIPDSFQTKYTIIALDHVDTDGSRILHTLLVKHYNDLFDRQSSERGKDEVTYVYVGHVFCIHFGTKYADFQEKIFAGISGKKFQTLSIQ